MLRKAIIKYLEGKAVKALLLINSIFLFSISLACLVLVCLIAGYGFVQITFQEPNATVLTIEILVSGIFLAAAVIGIVAGAVRTRMVQRRRCNGRGLSVTL